MTAIATSPEATGQLARIWAFGGSQRTSRRSIRQGTVPTTSHSGGGAHRTDPAPSPHQAERARQKQEAEGTGGAEEGRELCAGRHSCKGGSHEGRAKTEQRLKSSHVWGEGGGAEETFTQQQPPGLAKGSQREAAPSQRQRDSLPTAGEGRALPEPLLCTSTIWGGGCLLSVGPGQPSPPGPPGGGLSLHTELASQGPSVDATFG